MTGYLTKVNFTDGQNVKKGDLLYEIDPRPYQAELDRAKGELARLRALADKAKADLARSERLRPSGAVSQDEYEQHVANLAVHRASIQSAEAAIRDTQLNLEFTKITSPIDGRVSRTRITEGNLVQSGLGEATVLTMVVTTNPIYVYFNVDEHAMLQYEEAAFRSGEEHPKILQGRHFPVEIGLGNETGFPHQGVLDFADNKIDRNTGTLRARGVFENKKEYLTPGLFVRAAHSLRQAAPGALGQRARDRHGSAAEIPVDGEQGRRGRVPPRQRGPFAGWNAGDRIGAEAGRAGGRERIAACAARLEGAAEGGRQQYGGTVVPSHQRIGQHRRQDSDQLGDWQRCFPASSSTGRFWRRCRRF